MSVFELGYTLDEFTAEVNRESRIQYTTEQTAPFWNRGQSPAHARAVLSRRGV